jgi:hypothetical protein
VTARDNAEADRLDHHRPEREVVFPRSFVEFRHPSRVRPRKGHPGRIIGIMSMTALGPENEATTGFPAHEGEGPMAAEIALRPPLTPGDQPGAPVWATRS